MTKTATVNYKPSKADVTDKITASYKNKELVSKEFYIAPQIDFTWTLPNIFYLDEEEDCSFTPVLNGVTIIGATNFSIEDNLGNVVYKSTSQTLKPSTSGVFKVTPVESQKATGISFTISFELHDVEYTFTSETRPVQDESEGDYTLSVQEGKLVYDTEGHVVMSSDTTGIQVGETINFTSEQGLKADGKLQES